MTVNARRLVIPFIAVLVALSTSGCDWTMGGFDAANTNDNAADTTITASKIAGLTRRWSVTAGSLFQRPVVVGDTVYVDEELYDSSSGTTFGSRIAAIDLARGTRKWTTRALSSSFSGNRGIGPAVYGSTVFTVSGSQLIALSSKTGATMWTRPLGAGNARSVFVVGSTVFTANSAFDADSGAVRWTTDPTASVIAVSDGIAYFATLPDGGCSVGGALRALDTVTGRVRWTVALGTAVIAYTGTVVEKVLAVSLIRCVGLPGAWGFEALDAGSGVRRWTEPPTGAPLGGAAGRLFTQRGANLTSITAATDQTAWEVPIACAGAASEDGRGSLSIAIAGQIVFAALNGAVSAADLTTGAALRHWSVPSDAASIVVSGGCVLTEGGSWREPTLTADCVPTPR